MSCDDTTRRTLAKYFAADIKSVERQMHNPLTDVLSAKLKLLNLFIVAFEQHDIFAIEYICSGIRLLFEMHPDNMLIVNLFMLVDVTAKSSLLPLNTSIYKHFRNAIMNYQCTLPEPNFDKFAMSGYAVDGYAMDFELHKTEFAKDNQTLHRLKHRYNSLEQTKKNIYQVYEFIKSMYTTIQKQKQSLLDIEEND